MGAIKGGVWKKVRVNTKLINVWVWLGWCLPGYTMPQVRPQGGDTGQEVDKVVGMFELLQVPASIECGIFHWVFNGEDAGAGYRAVPDQLRKGRNTGCCAEDMVGGAAA